VHKIEDTMCNHVTYVRVGCFGNLYRAVERSLYVKEVRSHFVTLYQFLSNLGGCKLLKEGQ